MYDRINGVLDEAVGEGTHFRMPWFQTPNVMDIRTRPRSISSVTGTKGACGGVGRVDDGSPPPRGGQLSARAHPPPRYPPLHTHLAHKCEKKLCIHSHFDMPGKQRANAPSC